MTEPPGSPLQPSPPAPVPEPFGSAPIKPRAGGCGKPLFTGCGIVLVLLGVAAIVFIIRAKDLLVWSLGKVKAAVEQNLPPDVTAADRERFDVAFAAAGRAIRAGRAQPKPLQELQGELLRVIQKQKGELTRDDLVRLTEVLERVGGIGPEEEAAPPAESPSSAAAARASPLSLAA
jgi:hypothetical protein